MQFSPDESFIAKLRLLRLNDGPSQVMAISSHGNKTYKIWAILKKYVIIRVFFLSGQSSFSGLHLRIILK